MASSPSEITFPVPEKKQFTFSPFHRKERHLHLLCQHSMPPKMQEKKDQESYSSSIGLFKELRNVIM